ncbi:MAG: hypothetical protein Q8Q73_01150 [Stagnimonas sp.]|nr:hypothetical protein [Stagnimonas sp.]
MKSAAPLFLLAAVPLLAGLFWWFKPAAPATPLAAVADAPAPVVPAATEPVAAAVTTGLRAQLRIEQGELVGGARTLSVSQGSPVLIELLSDRAGELHLHGYDRELPVRAGELARLEFTPDQAGRFGLELHAHGGHVELGALEVLPR